MKKVSHVMQSKPCDAEQAIRAHLANPQGEPEPVNARRLAACWNFCDGVSTEALESAYPIGAHKDEAMRQRDALLDALREYIAAADNSMIATDDVAAMLRFGEADKVARAAIAKATGVQETGT